ncbi:PREDICTED: uncharacterized protein LOC105964384 [Erythranthe guttata]|uniref:uncharacterized protein LOC105964384 n=1 Tax=Erythranthe guttata TaxID=4155 RepID=UPI00064D9B36|nr:PREDICTED: uncharacterized protein LOC105964384 [Erythranthe guttata]|eukprot:XP_012844362.1 PREDICTED: uncharacterized protein LOC105964384 [Erythranthe guttata]
MCVEIPDEETDRKMYQLVEKYMIHGPLGQANLKSPCIKNRVCTKPFPKPFVQLTELDADDLSVSDESLMNYTFTEKEKILQSNSKSLRNYAPMPVPIEFAVEDTVNILVLDELDYDRFEMGRELQRCLASITDEQRKFYDVVMDDVSNDRGGMFFLYGHGGTGKTFLWKTLSAAFRSKGEIVINVASSALDKTMKSLLHVDIPFGGKVVVLGRDFRQILPVVLKASRQDIVREFGDWILKVGNGDGGEQNDGEASLEIPDDMLIGDSKDPFKDLLDFVYPDLLSNMYDPDYYQGRTILAPTNECVESVNYHLMYLLPGEEKLYLSSDSMCRDEQTTKDNAEIYSTEFLNTIRYSGVPSHVLKFKVGAPVMLIRNIDQARILCNGTRLQIIRTGIHVLTCKFFSGKNISDMEFIPRMTLIPSNSGLPIKSEEDSFR